MTGETFFARREGWLHAEDVPLRRIAQQAGTPTYVYSATALRQAYRELDRAFSAVPHRICYSVKANRNLAVVRTLAACGAGADVTSEGELECALRAGIDPDRIVFSGAGKTEGELARALAVGVGLFNVESRAELRRLDALAARRARRARIAFRVNPDIDAGTHPYIATGLQEAKFGIPIQEALDAYAEAKALDHVEAVGVDCHIGSQLLDLAPLDDALRRIRALVEALRGAGHPVRLVDVGGGLGVRYGDETPPSAGAYAGVVLGALGDLGCEIVLEPGRALAGPAGVLVTRVIEEKTQGEKRFLIVDAAMNDLIRPSLYGAFHRIEPVGPAQGPPREVDVVGPVCETGDFLARGRALPRVATGELLAVFTAGAYGFVMASNYNARMRAAEVLVRGARFAVVREREQPADLFRGERIPRELTE